MKGEKLVSWINSAANNAKYTGVELATVVSEYPKLRIKIDGMELELDLSFLIVPNIFFSDKCLVTADWVTTGSTVASRTGSSSSHTHIVPSQVVNSIAVENMETTIHCVLKSGDRIAVLPAMGGKRYMILDKVVMT